MATRCSSAPNLLHEKLPHNRRLGGCEPERQAAVECGAAVLQRLRTIADKRNTLVHHLGGVLQRLLKRKAELATDCTTGQLLAVHLATSVVKGGRSTAVLKTLCATTTASSALLSSYARYRLIKILCDVAKSVSSRNGSQNALYKAIHSGLATWFIRLAKSAEQTNVIGTLVGVVVKCNGEGVEDKISMHDVPVEQVLRQKHACTTRKKSSPTLIPFWLSKNLTICEWPFQTLSMSGVEPSADKVLMSHPYWSGRGC